MQYFAKQSVHSLFFYNLFSVSPSWCFIFFPFWYCLCHYHSLFLCSWHMFHIYFSYSETFLSYIPVLYTWIWSFPPRRFPIFISLQRSGGCLWLTPSDCLSYVRFLPHQVFVPPHLLQFTCLHFFFYIYLILLTVLLHDTPMTPPSHIINSMHPLVLCLIPYSNYVLWHHPCTLWYLPIIVQSGYDTMYEFSWTPVDLPLSPVLYKWSCW